MTYKALYQNGKQRLQQAQIESPAFDAMCLFEAAFSMNRTALAVHGAEEAPTEGIIQFNHWIQQRAMHTPLQYLLGEWPFLDLTLATGRGVLCPREDTEVLVEVAEEELRGRLSPVVLDLCAGTGAVGLGISSLRKDATVVCIEWYDDAFSYLEQNIAKNAKQASATAVLADVLQKPKAGQFPQADAIVSNPPYIETAVLKTLQPEVQQEPQEALDGGEDGLLFYHAIAQLWVPLLKEGGLIAVEIGEGQGQAVRRIFQQAGITQLEGRLDFGGIERVIYGRKMG